MTVVTSEHPDIAVTVDAVIFTERAAQPMVVLVERAHEPFRSMWALPGGFVEEGEDLPEAAARELEEETALIVPISSMTQLGAYGAPGRDPRMRVVSVVFWAYELDLPDPRGGSDAARSVLLPVSEALADDFGLAFDHGLILRDAWTAVATSHD